MSMSWRLSRVVLFAMGAAMIEGLPIMDIGAPAIVTLVVLLVLTDRLVWHKRLDVLTKQIEAKDAVIDELSKQNTMLLGSALPTVNAVMGALREAAGEKEIP